MRPGKRFGFSEVEKRKIWNRWKAGQSLHGIGRAFDKPHSSIRCLLLPRGGIPPATRRRSRLSLTLAEREDISRGIASGLPLREIARRLDRATSTVSREISRNGGRPTYRAHAADDQAWDSALRPKKCLLAIKWVTPAQFLAGEPRRLLADNFNTRSSQREIQWPASHELDSLGLPAGAFDPFEPGRGLHHHRRPAKARRGTLGHTEKGSQ